MQHLSTSSLFNLYHTSRYFRSFLTAYPLAWTSLSFRLCPLPGTISYHNHSTTTETAERASRAYALDALLIQVVVPVGTRLRSLDLCNTAVSGMPLISNVVEPRRNTLQHLSVRGCKNVSVKYHIVPFLQTQLQTQAAGFQLTKLALESLYTYRCRHHRRRPYLPTSLIRRDSDSEPTHELIDLCHRLRIWTDTAWCPTPGPRCFRRKEYYASRATPGNAEVWVPFDRLWRCGNRVGSAEDASEKRKFEGFQSGKLWEELEHGEEGEPLGTANGQSVGEGKGVPTHLRKSHTSFIQNISCGDCGDVILERCEQCSVRMHCLGCRKTLCASCAFTRPLPKKRKRSQPFASHAALSNPQSAAEHSAAHPIDSPSLNNNNNNNIYQSSDRFWWAPGAWRSPNKMSSTAHEDDSSDSEHDGHHDTHNPAQLDMYWCCLTPMFSGGGGIAILGPGLGGKGADRIRTAPLPKGQNFEDPEFCIGSAQYRHLEGDDRLQAINLLSGGPPDIFPYLQQRSMELQTTTCPRSLCKDCYSSMTWKVPCMACRKALCREHDFRGLKVRKCGYRDLEVERAYVRNPPAPTELAIPAYRSPSISPSQNRVVSMESQLSLSTNSEELEQQVLESTITSRGQSSNMQDETDLSEPSTPTLSSAALFAASPPNSSASASTLSPLPLTSNTPFVISAFGVSQLPLTRSDASTRPRSLSLSALSSSINQTPSNPPSLTTRAKNVFPEPRLPLPCYPGHPVQYRGCGAYFCPSSRPVGDNRPHCRPGGHHSHSDNTDIGITNIPWGSGGMKECYECLVWVCRECFLMENVSECTCKYCHNKFWCGVCRGKSKVRKKCVLEKQERERLEKEVRKVMKEEAIGVNEHDEDEEGKGKEKDVCGQGSVGAASEIPLPEGGDEELEEEEQDEQEQKGEEEHAKEDPSSPSQEDASNPLRQIFPRSSSATSPTLTAL